MIIDKKYISATIKFLKIFNLKLQNLKVEKLSQKLDNNGMILIYDYDNNEVGEIIKINNCYCMNISYLDSKISVTSYRNLKEQSSYVFRYNIFNFYTKESIDGYYEIRKNKNNDFSVESNYKVYKNRDLNIKCSFDNIRNVFIIKDYKTERRAILDADSFNTSLNSCNLNANKYNNLIYFEKLDKKKDSHYNKAEGYTLSDKSSFEKEVLTIINNEIEEYYEYIEYMKEKSNNIFPHFYEDNVNEVLYKDSDSSKKKLFSGRQK